MLNIPLAISAQQINYNLPQLARGVHVRLNGAVLAAMYEGRITSDADQPSAGRCRRLAGRLVPGSCVADRVEHRWRP
jgi:hypothetical protein